MLTREQLLNGALPEEYQKAIEQILDWVEATDLLSFTKLCQDCKYKAKCDSEEFDFKKKCPSWVASKNFLRWRYPDEWETHWKKLLN